MYEEIPKFRCGERVRSKHNEPWGDGLGTVVEDNEGPMVRVRWGSREPVEGTHWRALVRLEPQ